MDNPNYKPIDELFQRLADQLPDTNDKIDLMTQKRKLIQSMEHDKVLYEKLLAELAKYDSDEEF